MYAAVTEVREGRGTTGSRLTFEEYCGDHGLDALWTEWSDLVGRIPECRSHQRPEAFRSYLMLTAPEQVFFLAARDGGELKAIVPLRFGSDHPLHVSKGVASVAWHFEWPIGEVIAPEEEVRAVLLPSVLEFLHGSAKHGAHLLAVGPAPTASRLWEGIAEVRGPYLVEEGADDRIDCTGDFETYRAGLSKNFRNNLRKARNKLAQLPDVRFISVTEPAEVTRELRTFVELEASGWKGRTPGGVPIASEERFVRFYEDFYKRFAGVGLAEINALYSGDTCLASELCVRGCGIYEMHKIAFDERFANLAPGQLLFEHTARRCFEDGSVEWLDLITDARWHNDWKAAAREMRRAYMPIDAIGWMMMPFVKARFGPMRTIARRIKSRRQMVRK